MLKRIFSLIFFLILISFPAPIFAKVNSFVSVVNPIRGADFWEQKNQQPEDVIKGQLDILKKYNVAATWLIRFDALENSQIIQLVNKNSNDEKGLFLEVTPTWTNQAGVKYRISASWHSAASAFLTGYEREEREKLIDAAFNKFKDKFNFYPKSVGAWWIDSYSLSYMQKKYGIIAALIVSDQYTTDNYQIWGQYFSTPYYPAKNNALHPAGSLENKLPVVITQWAPRDPVNSYGNGVQESSFSVQANDYIDYHDLDIDYFSKLLDIYSNQPLNKFSHLVVGLENTYDWSKYGTEYKKQIDVLVQKNKRESLNIVTLQDFAFWYQKAFPNLSPEQIIVANDPLGSFKKVIWFMNPYYRAGWFFNNESSVFRDIRQYIDGEEEICFKKRCDEVNFATFATRVLDEVSFGHRWVIDEGKIKDFKISKLEDKFVINYLNEAGKLRTIELLPRDISVDGKISSIDGAILEAVKQDTASQLKPPAFKVEPLRFSLFSVVLKVVALILFLTVAILIPGFVLTNNLYEKNKPFLQRIFLSSTTGFVLLTIIFYISSLLNLRFVVFFYLLVGFLLFLKLKVTSTFKFSYPKADKITILSILLILGGTIFQNIPTFKNGLIFSFGMGLWGPNTHDGIWHISLINQLIKSVPPQNPIYSGEILKNYHFFYDLLVAATVYLTAIPVVDLVFRFYPVLFSLSLGIGTYYLINNLFEERLGRVKAKIASLLSLYLVYFAGSFGWIVSYIKEQAFAGESAFWANQSISFNLNPPFAISLVIIIALMQLLILPGTSRKIIILAIILAGSLIGFKSYGAVLILLTLLLVGVFKRRPDYLKVFAGALIISSLIFFSNFQINTQLVIFSPFWFIHSMIDSPDRVGWMRLTLARTVGFEQGIWWKFITAEVLSLVIFILGNLGIRFLSLLSLIKIKSIIEDNNLFFLLILSTLSILIPILFIQAGNPWNTIQFLYYGLYVAAAMGGVGFLSLIVRVPKVILAPSIILFIIITPINSLVTASYYLNYLPHARVDKKELEALEFLSKQKDGVVLTYPYDSKFKKRIAEPWPLFVYDSTSYVSAFSKKSVFIEDEPQNQILLTDYKKRLVAANDLFIYLDSQTKKNFLDLNKIKYIYLPKFFNISIDEFSLDLKTIFENEEVKIYQRI